MARKFPNQPGGGQKNMMKQIQKMQQDMLELQQEMEERVYITQAAGPRKLTVTGKRRKT